MATSFSPSSTSASAATSRTTRTSAAPEVTSGDAGPATTGRTPVPSLPVDSAMSCSAQSAKPTMPEPSSAMTILLRSGLVPPRAVPRARPMLSGGVLVEDLGCFFGLIQESLDVHSGQAAGDQAERGQCREAAADVGVGVEDRTVAGLAGRLVQRRTGIRDDDDAALGIDAGIGERLLEDPALRIGFDGGTGLGRNNNGRFGQPVHQCSTDLFGVGAVQHSQLDASSAGNDLRSQRGATHATEDDAGYAFGLQRVAKFQNVRQPGPARRWPPRPSPAG